MSNQMVGDEDGIKLWNMMANSEDKIEQTYFNSLNSAASKYGKVWFSDLVTQKNDKKNQTTWQMIWEADKAQWVVSLFHIPEGVEKVSDRIKSYGEEEIWIEIDPDDIIVSEE